MDGHDGRWPFGSFPVAVNLALLKAQELPIPLQYSILRSTWRKGVETKGKQKQEVR